MVPGSTQSYSCVSWSGCLSPPLVPCCSFWLRPIVLNCFSASSSFLARGGDSLSPTHGGGIFHRGRNGCARGARRWSACAKDATEAEAEAAAKSAAVTCAGACASCWEAAVAAEAAAASTTAAEFFAVACKWVWQTADSAVAAATSEAYRVLAAP